MGDKGKRISTLEQKVDIFFWTGLGSKIPRIDRWSKEKSEGLGVAKKAIIIELRNVMISTLIHTERPININ